jgi:DMSO/TMAO reductase YedYZ heme-binding membrane subunit/nitrite reductase/ring-hydroxylating ferredoxin subunit
MSVQYQAIGWSRQKKIYDGVLTGGVALYLAVFLGLGTALHPAATVETLLIRGLGTLALLLLHVILAIGPLCRLDSRFLPLLYNRRHLGVTMFLLALAHGVFSLVQFHAFGDLNPFVSLLVSNTSYGSLASFPFQILGFAALLILFLMAATSHDFWLHNLGAPIWKGLHMLVYLAYGLLIGHVALGALQSETSPWLVAVLAPGLATIIVLHLAGGFRERAGDREAPLAEGEYVDAGEVSSIPEKRARVVTIGGERVAVFRYDGKVSAISNVCRHQNGPLGEGRIVDGCITCPWHGYQYLPGNGCSPPPFTDQVPTFLTKVVGGRVWVHRQAHAPGTALPPSRILP